MKKIVAAIAAAVGLFAVTEGHAAVLTGQMLGFQRYWPTKSDPYGGFIEIDTSAPVNFNYGGYFWLSIDGDEIKFDSTDWWMPVPADFNGFVFTDYTNSISSFTGVSLVSTFNVPGLDSSRLSFDADKIYVNLSGIDFFPNSDFKIKIYADGAAAGAVPEPATWAMMIGGSGLIGSALRRRRQSRPLFSKVSSLR